MDIDMTKVRGKASDAIRVHAAYWYLGKKHLRIHGLSEETNHLELQREFCIQHEWDRSEMPVDIIFAIRGRCPWCHEPYPRHDDGLYDLSKLQADHHDPRLPPNYRANIRWICWKCNGEKGSMHPELFAAKMPSRLRRPIYRPQSTVKVDSTLPAPDHGSWVGVKFEQTSLNIFGDGNGFC